MAKVRLAMIIVIPLLLVVLLTAVNRFWDWPTEGLRIPVGLGSALLLGAGFTFMKKKPSEG